MKLKKIYLEITNKCNLSCSFCIKNKKKITSITLDNYKYIIDKIKPYTKELYLHILGEPLMHPDINYFIDYATNAGLMVNITTNGYLINNIKDNHNIHRLNISLHSYHEKYNIHLEDYLNNIFNVVDSIRDKAYVSLRLWVKDNHTSSIIAYLNNRYHTDISSVLNNQKIKITNNLLIDTFHCFIWPDLNNSYYCDKGTCRGLIDHIGILSDGTIVPCCLDTTGVLNLGNIYQDNIPDIYKKPFVKEMIQGFKENKKIAELCKHCHFLEVKNENTKLEK